MESEFQDSSTALRRFADQLRHESVGGITVTLGAILAVVWSAINEHSYQKVINGEWPVPFLVQRGLGSLHGVTVNLLMTAFFLVVGLELGEEYKVGALKDRRAAILPVAAAIGGMVVTGALFALLGTIVHDGQIVRGWGVPTATDIAFALGALAIVGRRVPSSLRVFLLTLAIADDLFAVVILAVAFSHGTRPLWLIGPVLVVALILLVRRPLPTWLYVVALAITWACFVGAHVEPALAGVLIGVLVPFGQGQPGGVLEHAVLPLSNGLVLPLFALCACGVAWSELHWNTKLWQIIGAIVIARIIGKTFGITATVLIGTRLGLAAPSGVTTPMLLGAGALCAVGFTVPLLFAEAVYGFTGPEYAAVTLGLLIASALAAVIGIGLLRRFSPSPSH